MLLEGFIWLTASLFLSRRSSFFGNLIVYELNFLAEEGAFERLQLYSGISEELKDKVKMSRVLCKITEEESSFIHIKPGT